MALKLMFKSLILCVLAARYTIAQDAIGKVHLADVYLKDMKKDAMHSHLGRMLQVEMASGIEEVHVKDPFGIPLPVAPSESLRKLSTDSEPHSAKQPPQQHPQDRSIFSTSYASTNTAASSSAPLEQSMTKQEDTGPRLAATVRHITIAAARAAALERKRQFVRKERAAEIAAKKAKKMTAATTAGLADRRAAGSTQKEQQQRRRTANTASVTHTLAATASWSALGCFFVTLCALGAVAALLVAAAAFYDALLAPRFNGTKAYGSLWRRLRRAFAAARKTLTGHGSDLPMSVNEGATPLVHAIAAASAFGHVFWMHLKGNRGQHIGDAFIAAIVASRRVSVGGYIPDVAAAAAAMPDCCSAGGPPPASSSSYYLAGVSPFASPHVQRRVIY